MPSPPPPPVSGDRSLHPSPSKFAPGDGELPTLNGRPEPRFVSRSPSCPHPPHPLRWCDTPVEGYGPKAVHRRRENSHRVTPSGALSGPANAERSWASGAEGPAFPPVPELRSHRTLEPMTPSLFDDPTPSPAQWFTAHCDGGSRGNPGPSAYGAVIEDPQGREVARLSKFLGRQTNNFAEYSGLLAVLHWAIDNGVPRLRVVSDSELMVKQMKGQYKV